MESPFDTPTVRPSDPINDALKADFDQPGTARSTNLRVSSPPSLRPPMSPPTSSYDHTTSRSGSRMAQARPSPAASLSTKSKLNSLYPNAPSSSAFAKNPKKQSKRLANDRSKRSSWNAETQSVMSQQSRQPQAQDFQEPSSEELVRFAALSRRQYYDGDKEAGTYKLMCLVGHIKTDSPCVATSSQSWRDPRETPTRFSRYLLPDDGGYQKRVPPGQRD